MKLSTIDEMQEEQKDMRNDLNNLIDAYWYAISTRDCTLFPNEQMRDEEYCKKLIVKYPH
jgi:hypothetical protein